jgi:ribonuclease HI
MNHFFLNTDGGSRGNPGVAGCGAVLYDEHEKEVANGKRALGTTTNNVAEYEAVLLGLEVAERYISSHATLPYHLTIRMDSELVCKQLRGEYRVKDAKLIPLFARLRTLLSQKFPRVSFVHVRREKNKRADELANEAMDEGVR